MREGTFHYFAYGSNMFTAWLRQPQRCPSAKALGIAELHEHELHWHKASKDGSGKCDVVASAAPNASVPGVLYEIANDEKSGLDQAEGLGFGYEEIEIDGLCSQGQGNAKAYRATNTDPTLKPYTWYRALVIAGAREHCLPTSYIARLEAVPATEDPEPTRHDKNMALIAGALA